MGSAESSAYRNHLSRFLPEEQSDIDGIFDILAAPSGSAGEKNGKATKKTVTLAALKAYTREPLPEQMTVRLYNGMKSIDLSGKSSGLSEQIAKEQFVIFMSNLLKGNAAEKITIIMRMISKAEGPVKGKQIQEFTEDLIMSVVHVLNYRKELKGWTLENTRDSASGVKALASQLLSELKFAGSKSCCNMVVPVFLNTWTLDMVTSKMKRLLLIAALQEVMKPGNDQDTPQMGDLWT